MFLIIKNIDKTSCVYLNYPHTNKLNHEFLNQIYDVLQKIEENENINTVILLSNLTFGFSSGLDLNAFFDENDQNAFMRNVFEAVKLVYMINRLIISSKKIYIAALSGPVIGSAASIAFCCDFRIAKENTWFWLPDVQYGGLLAEGGLDIINHIVGNSRAKMLCLTNDRLNAKTAMEWGLLYKIVPEGDLYDFTVQFSGKINKYSYESLALSKEIINAQLNNLFHENKLLEILKSNSTFERMKKYITNPKDI